MATLPADAVAPASVVKNTSVSLIDPEAQGTETAAVPTSAASDGVPPVVTTSTPRENRTRSVRVSPASRLATEGSVASIATMVGGSTAIWFSVPVVYFPT